MVIWLVGVPVTVEDARALIAKLIHDDSPDALGAARTIGYAVRNEIPVVSLTPQQRDAILTVLVNPPAGLRELHSILARDLLERKTP